MSKDAKATQGEAAARFELGLALRVSTGSSVFQRFSSVHKVASGRFRRISAIRHGKTPGRQVFRRRGV
jgi:hypothetical protein